jgi:fimbrial isopeptide formation D2 family protein/LPXTG-motif cell wall-anchored protein
MKKIHRVLALLLAALMALGLMTTAFAATDSAPTIDPGKKASLSIYKYDITKASNDGAWDTESYVSTGLHDDAVIDKLSKYAIQGVEFTYLRVADITMNSEVVEGQRQVGVLYGLDNSDRSTAVLSSIGLTASDAHKTEGGVNYFTSDTLNNKLAAALAANATNVKNALEIAVKNGGVAMTETDTTGHTSASNMEQGLYLVVETRVPEMVTSTCNPFFVSLPMTTIDGSEWTYDIAIYPKNQTGNPTLSKTVREDKNSTVKNNGSLTDITDGFKHTATASVGDVVDYQILSTLPTITSRASSLSEYTYVDTMSRGIKYNMNDVVIEFFRDSACTDKITTWNENSGKFTIVYDDTANTMTIRMTEAGLSEINEATSVYTDSVKRGYSDCAMRITYAATLTADAKMGDTDNPNEVELTWRRTNSTYFDTLNDCCHVYTYGVDVLKQFSDGKGNIQNVKFNLHNDTDNCYIIADLKDGIYYAKGVTTKKSDATTFVPNGSGHIVVKGLEDDSYSLTEIATDKGYVLLKEAVKIVITTKENGTCEQCGAKLLTASATVNGKDVTMTDGNAIVPLTVVNNPGFDLPKTGGYGTWMFTIGGILLLGTAAFIVVKSRKHKSKQ